MLRAATPFWLLVCAAFAQDPASLFEKAPPNIDEALRARVNQFYQLHTEGKFRAADQLVAEDSKDAFFDADKPRCRAFAIGSIKYSDEFTRAQVMVACDLEMTMMGRRIPVKRPLSSRWKTVENQWFWYTEPAGDREVVTPFGVHKPSAPEESSGTGRPAGPQVGISDLAKSVQADKKEVRFSASEAGNDKIVLTNQLPGSVSLSLQGKRVPGLSYRLDRTTLAQGETAVLTIAYRPPPSRQPFSTVLRIVVAPTSQVIILNIDSVAPRATPPAN